MAKKNALRVSLLYLENVRLEKSLQVLTARAVASVQEAEHAARLI